jgi:hypothetical protein
MKQSAAAAWTVNPYLGEPQSFFSLHVPILCMQGAVLTVTKPRRRRNRIVAFLSLPAVAFMMLVGWSLYWIGHQREAKSKPRAKRGPADVTLVPAVAVEEEPLEETIA